VFAFAFALDCQIEQQHIVRVSTCIHGSIIAGVQAGGSWTGIADGQPIGGQSPSAHSRVMLIMVALDAIGERFELRRFFTLLRWGHS
jgi:hypothetical protein